MNVNIAVAFSKNYGIGLKNNLPWSHLKKDMTLFSKRTTGSGNNAVIMGKNTWFSIPEHRRPLKNRTNIVISSSCSCLTGNPHVFSSITDAMTFCESAKYDKVWIIGGSQLYNEFLNTYCHMLNRVYITYVCGDYECDTFIHFTASDYYVEEEEYNSDEKCFYLSCFHNSHKDHKDSGNTGNRDKDETCNTLEVRLKHFMQI